MYQITDYTKKQAKLLGVDVQPSKNKTKKIDVIKDGQIICSIGSINYLDYPTYLQTKGKQYAEERRRLYRIRHKKDIEKINSNGYYAGKLLW